MLIEHAPAVTCTLDEDTAGQPPAGDPLSLGEAADRLLARGPRMPRASGGPFVVLCSAEDPRHPAQTRLAEELGATVRWIDGGHLFPVTQGQAAAEGVLEALDELDHRNESA